MQCRANITTKLARGADFAVWCLFGCPTPYATSMHYLIMTPSKTGRMIRAARKSMAKQTIMVVIFLIAGCAPFRALRASRSRLLSCSIGGVHCFIGCVRLNSLQEHAEKLCSIRRCHKEIVGAAIEHLEP